MAHSCEAAFGRLPWRCRLLQLFRLLPEGLPGKTRLARGVRRWLGGAADVQLQSRFGEIFGVPSLEESIAFHLLIDGVYEPATRRFLLQQLRPGDTFLEVGANIGVFTVAASQRVGPQGRVIAIEASPRIVCYLEANVRANRLGNVVLIQCAVQDVDSPGVDFFDAPASHFGMGALAAQFGSPAQRVAGRRLDSLRAEWGGGRVALLKVDVEGFEAAVFRGAGELLSRDRPWLTFEFADWAEQRAGFRPGDAQRVLVGHGYRLWRLADYLGGARPLAAVLEVGADMLVAMPPGLGT
jgi:FkbM family methyltransferase